METDAQKFSRGWQMKKWLIVEAGLLVAIIFVCLLIKIQLTPVAQAQVRDDFEIYVQTEQGLVPYSQVKIVKIEPEVKAILTHSETLSLQQSAIFSHRRDVQQKIRKIEPEWADTLIKLAHCESSLNPQAVGDHGHSHGLYQIYLKWHPEVSLEQAQDIEFATRWTAQKIQNGQGHLWSCWNKI